jgi:hypothetical protein
MQLIQGRSAVLDLVLRTDDPARLFPPRAGLGAADVICQLKRAGATAWASRPLDPASLREVGQGAYLLSLDASELDTLGTLLVLVTGQPSMVPGILPSLTSAEVVAARQFRAARPDLPATVLIGQIAGLDGRPIARATLTATLLQAPLVLEGIAVAGDAVIGASDDDGFFELPLLSGATVDVEIPALRYRRTLVVPTPPAPGAPVRLFSIP